MNVLESFRIAWTALMSNKLRALLTMLGIIIGVGAVIGMLAIGNGLLSAIQGDFERLGVGVFYITPDYGSREASEPRQPRLTAADAEAIRQSGATPAVKTVAVEYSSNAVVSAGKDRYFYGIKSVTPSFFAIGDNQLGPGEYFTAAQDRDRARVTVIGEEVAKTLFGNLAGAVGQRITIDGVGFDVVGVLTTKPGQTEPDFNSPATTVYIPYQTGRARLFRNEISARVDLAQITVQAQDKDQIDTAIAQVKELLRARHRLAAYQADDFRIENPEELLATINATFIGLNAFFGTIAGIALLVGGIGIMNIMLVSVTQRTREIGLRKAVGARRWAILQQFLIESLMLCLIGCALGVALGYALSFAGTFVIRQVFRLEEAYAVISPGSVVLAIGISAGIGIFFGFWPAWRASRMQPVQALRSE
ncbi:MAG: ABC transporter permease [Roseiflexaceae bacterium]